MEGVGQDMMQDECGTADGKVSTRKAQLNVLVELLIRQAGQICEGLLANIALQKPGVSDGGAVSRIPIGILQPLQRAYPESFAVENVDYLFAQRRESEARRFR